MVTALAILMRLALGGKPGDIVLVAAHTHTAVQTLLERVRTVEPVVRAALASAGKALSLPELTVGKLFSSHAQAAEATLGAEVEAFGATGLWSVLKPRRKDQVIVLGGTTSSLLKLTEDLSKKAAFRDLPQKFQTPLLIIDEASMMVSAHFFALATLLLPHGHLMLAGDHRQLAPILSHEWDKDARPPAQKFQMHASAFHTIHRLRYPPLPAPAYRQLQDAQIRCDKLTTTFRLPAQVRLLIQPLYDRDDLTLKGRAMPGLVSIPPGTQNLDLIWSSPHSVYLVLHEESGSGKQNDFEAYLVKHILQAGLDTGLVEDGSVVVLTPHRAQRAALQDRLAPYAKHVAMIDTVERLQGGEAPTVMYSATVSGPIVIDQEMSFLMDVERTNVAFSRGKRRLIVLCSRTLIDTIPPRLEDYEAALLWKRLRLMCRHRIAHGELGPHRYDVLVPSLTEEM